MLVQNQASLADFSERVDWLDQMLSQQNLEAIDIVTLPELFAPVTISTQQFMIVPPNELASSTTQ